MSSPLELKKQKERDDMDIRELILAQQSELLELRRRTNDQTRGLLNQIVNMPVVPKPHELKNCCDSICCCIGYSAVIALFTFILGIAMVIAYVIIWGGSGVLNFAGRWALPASTPIHTPNIPLHP